MSQLHLNPVSRHPHAYQRWAPRWSALGLHLQDVRGDGDCLFAALSLILHDTIEERMRIRLLALEERVREHDSGYLSLSPYLRERYQDVDVDRYRLRMASPNLETILRHDPLARSEDRWGCTEEAAALARKLNRPLFIWTPTYSSFKHHHADTAEALDELRNGIHVYHVSNNHFAALLRRDRVLLPPFPSHHNTAPNLESVYMRAHDSSYHSLSSARVLFPPLTSHDHHYTAASVAATVTSNAFATSLPSARGELNNSLPLLDPTSSISAASTGIQVNDFECQRQRRSNGQERSMKRARLEQLALLRCSQVEDWFGDRVGGQMKRPRVSHIRSKQGEQGRHQVPDHTVAGSVSGSRSDINDLLPRPEREADVHDIHAFQAQVEQSSQMVVCCSCGELLSEREMDPDIYHDRHSLLIPLNQGFFPSDESSSHRLCCDCKHHLYTKASPPQFSKLNGFDFGTVPPVLHKLSLNDRRLISLVTPILTIVTWQSDHRVKKVKGHVLNLRNDVVEVASSLPRHPSRSGVYTYQVTSRVHGKVYPALRYDPKLALSALQWLKANNPLYSHIDIISEEEQSERLQDALSKEQAELEEEEEMNSNATSTGEEGQLQDEQSADAGSSQRGAVPPSSSDAGTVVNVNRDQSMDRTDDTPRHADPEFVQQQLPINYIPSDPEIAGLSDVFLHENSSDDQPASAQGSSQLNPSSPSNSSRPSRSMSSPAHLQFHMPRAPAAHNASVTLADDPNLIVSAFPHLFPFGRGGPVAPAGSHRQTPVKFGYKYVRHLLRFHDQRFARDRTLLFWLLNIMLRKRVNGLARIVERLSMVQHSSFAIPNPRTTAHAGSPTTGSSTSSTSSSSDTDDVDTANVGSAQQPGGQDSSSLHLRARHLQRTLIRFGQAMPGTTASMLRHQQEVLAQVNATCLPVPTPTFFFTLSSADRSWPELYRMIRPGITDDQLSQLSNTDREQMLLDNPVLAAQHFYERFEAYKGHVINGRSKALGDVTDFVYRVEFQGRGSLHIHGLIWCKEMKDVVSLLKTEQGRQEMAEWFDTIVSCSVDQPATIPADMARAKEDNQKGIPRIYLKPTPLVPLSHPNQRALTHSFAKLMNVHTHTATCVKYYKSLRDNPHLRAAVIAHLNRNAIDKTVGTEGSKKNADEEMNRGKEADDTTMTSSLVEPAASSVDPRLLRYKCRFHYPKSLRSQTTVQYGYTHSRPDAASAAVAASSSGFANQPYPPSTSKRSSRVNIEIKRNHAHLNNYHALTAVLWRANHDISPVVNPWGAAVYIAKYVCKPDESDYPALTAKLIKALEKLKASPNPFSQSIAAQVRAAGMTDVGSREFCAQEAVWIIMGRRLVEQSRDVVRVDVGSVWSSDGEVRIIDPTLRMEELVPDSVLAELTQDTPAMTGHDVAAASAIEGAVLPSRLRMARCAVWDGVSPIGGQSKRGMEIAYQNRPEQLEDMTYHTFLSRYRGLRAPYRGRNVPVGVDEQIFVQIRNALTGGTMIRALGRRHPDAVVAPVPLMDWDQGKPASCFAILLLHVPWRQEADILVDGDPVNTLQLRIENNQISAPILHLLGLQRGIRQALEEDAVAVREAAQRERELDAIEGIGDQFDDECDPSQLHAGEVSAAEIQASEQLELASLQDKQLCKARENPDVIHRFSHSLLQGDVERLPLAEFQQLRQWLHAWLEQRSSKPNRPVRGSCTLAAQQQTAEQRESEDQIHQQQLSKMLSQLNQSQRHAMRLIVDALERDPYMKEPLARAPPLRLIIIGSGGTGKSFFIQTLLSWIRCNPRFGCRRSRGTDHSNARNRHGQQRGRRARLKSAFLPLGPVAVLAFTGAAAFQVGGQTVHSAFRFSINDEQRKPTEKVLTALRQFFRRVRVIVLDEISLITAKMLQRINIRLQQIFPSHSHVPFGGRHVILCGDFYQLPPVQGVGLYTRVRLPSSGAVSVADQMQDAGQQLYANFHRCLIFEQQHRQNNPELIALLGRARTGRLTEEDVRLLNTRVFVSSGLPSDSSSVRTSSECLAGDDDRGDDHDPDDDHEAMLRLTDQEQLPSSSALYTRNPPIDCMSCSQINKNADEINTNRIARHVHELHRSEYVIWACHSAVMLPQPSLERIPRRRNDAGAPDHSDTMNMHARDSGVDLSNIPMIEQEDLLAAKAHGRAMRVASPLDSGVRLALSQDDLGCRGLHGKKVKPNLVARLNLTIGARVMLTKNLNVGLGLVNGSMGTVVRLLYCAGSVPIYNDPTVDTAERMAQVNEPHQVPVVLVRFDGEYFSEHGYHDQVGVVPIVPMVEHLSVLGGHYLRLQVPLKLGWALTIHRMQGRTLDYLAVNPPDETTLKRNRVPRGLMYVAISRVRQLSGLFLYAPLTVSMFNGNVEDLNLVNAEMERLQVLHNDTLKLTQELEDPATEFDAQENDQQYADEEDLTVDHERDSDFDVEFDYDEIEEDNTPP